MIWVKPWLGWGQQLCPRSGPLPRTSRQSVFRLGAAENNIYLLWWPRPASSDRSSIFGCGRRSDGRRCRTWKVRDEVMYVANAAALAGLIAFAVDGFLSFPSASNQPQRVFWSLAAMIMAVRYWRLRQPAPALQPGKQGWLSGAGLLPPRRPGTSDPAQHRDPGGRPQPVALARMVRRSR